MSHDTKSPALLALTASALAALGSAPRAQAQEAVPAATQTDVRVSYYKEDALPASKVTAGNGQRYEILTNQFSVVQPFGSGNALNANLDFEAMSGASPRFVQPDVNGKPVEVMSGASIEDKRVGVKAGVSRNKARTQATLTLGFSKEKDYQAISGALEVANTLTDRLTTLSWGLGYSGDSIDPTQGKTKTGTLHDSRSEATGFVGIARVLDAETVIRTSLSYTQNQGYLSDPYKEAYVVSLTNTVFDHRPDKRGQFAWLTSLRRFFKGADAALQADYRYYHDDWKVDAHAVDVSWQQNFGHGLRVAPGVRWYSQSEAFFYAPYYAAPRADGLASSDYRLAPYGAISANLTASWDFAPDWNASLHYERYDSGGSYALGKVAIENPGLVDFQVISLGLKKVF